MNVQLASPSCSETIVVLAGARYTASEKMAVIVSIIVPGSDAQFVATSV